MAKLNWGVLGERYFEVGVDRGVLYIGETDGVTWNGLVTVSEAPTGGDIRPYYIEGFKYLNLSGATEFAATIEAFSAPESFNQCDGTVAIHNGLFATQQPRKPFNFSYRTLVGNDTESVDHGYKIHLVYNALASPSQRNNSTIGDSPTPITFSWGITTSPMIAEGYSATSHYIIDSRKTPAALLSQIEAILYGTEETDPRLPPIAELINSFDTLLTILPYKARWISDDNYVIDIVDPIDSYAVMTPNQPLVTGTAPMLWFDTSQGDYALVKLVTGE